MKKIIWIIVGLIIVGYFVKSYLNNEAQQRAEQAKKDRIEKKINEEINQFAVKENAITNWDKVLSGGKRIRSEPILTIELEKLWIRKRPILFSGLIKDISGYDETDYRVLMERDFPLNSKYMFADELRLSLICNKKIIDTLLANNPELLKNSGFYDNIVVIAQINSIKTQEIQDNSGDTDNIKIGEGRLIDIKYLGKSIY